MRNYIIAFLAICFIVVLSFMCRNSQKPVPGKFPVEGTLEEDGDRRGFRGCPLFFSF